MMDAQDRRDFFEERSGHVEFDAGFQRPEAEAMALTMLGFKRTAAGEVVDREDWCRQVDALG